MPSRPFLIANTRKGLERDVEAFLLPQDAYVDLEDVYMFRGRIPMRQGLSALGQLVTAVINEAVGMASGTTFSGTLAHVIINPGSVVITVGAVTFTDVGDGTLAGTPAGNSGTINYFTGAIVLTFSPGIGATAVVANYQTINGLPVMGLRTREISTINVEQLIAFDTTKANAFFSNAVPPQFEDISFFKTTNVPFSWTGNDSQFFWSTNYQNAFFATNYVPGFAEFVITAINDNATATITFTGGDVFVNGDKIAVTNGVATNPQVINGLSGTVTAHAAGSVTVTIDTASVPLGYISGGILYSLTRSSLPTPTGDGIRWYDGTGWVNFQPPLSATATGTNVSILQGALILLPYKNRMVALNTIEGTSAGTSTVYLQRARFSQNGTVYYNNFVPSGFTGGSQSDAWRDDIVGKGGYIDAPTQEQIVSAEFIKDTLIVFFERSTYQLRYTGDPTIPFIWEKINTELGAESTFSVVPFDRGAFGVGNYGIITCDSVNVQRIDQIIPDEVFNIHNENDGVKRVHGIRDYVKQLVYWTFPNDFVNNDGATNKFPTRLLVYNYLDGSYSFFNDSLTCFGNYQSFNDVRWKDLKIAWKDYPVPWNEGALQRDFPDVVAGNQQGFVFAFNDPANQVNNDPSLRISGASQALPCQLTVVNHNLQDNQFIQISGVNGMTQLNNLTVAGSSGSPFGIYKVLKVTGNNTFTIGYVETLTTSPNYGDTQEVDSTALTAYTNGGVIAVINNFSITTKQFNPFAEEGNQVRINYCDVFLEGASGGEFSINYFTNQNDDLPVSVTLSTAQSVGQEKIWFRNIPNATGQYIQLEFKFSDVQMATPASREFYFVLHAMALWFDPGSRFMFGRTI